jgi:hypothetical protein
MVRFAWAHAMRTAHTSPAPNTIISNLKHGAPRLRPPSLRRFPPLSSTIYIYFYTVTPVDRRSPQISIARKCDLVCVQTCWLLRCGLLPPVAPGFDSCDCEVAGNTQSASADSIVRSLVYRPSGPLHRTPRSYSDQRISVRVHATRGLKLKQYTIVE